MTERLLALLVVAASGAYLLSAWPLPHGTTARPGAGFFPLGVGAFGAIMALVWTVSAFRRRAAAGRVERRRGARRGESSSAVVRRGVDILTRPITMTLLLLGVAAVVAPWVVRRLR